VKTSLLLILAAALLAACSDSAEEPVSKRDGPVQLAFLIDIPPNTPPDILRPFINDPMAENLADFGYTEEDVESTTIASGDVIDLGPIVEGIDIIYAVGIEPLRKALASDLDIPVVFFISEAELVADDAFREELLEQDLMTGVITPQVDEKRFDLMMQLNPDIERVFVPYNPELRQSLTMYETVTEIAPDYGVTLLPYEYTDVLAALRSFTEIPDDADAVFLGSDAAIGLTVESSAVVPLEKGMLLAFSLPNLEPEIPLTYGANADDGQRIVARLVAQILDGTQPSDLPLQYTDPQFVLSLGAMEALNLEVSNAVLEQAHIIIREEVDVTVVVADAGFCNATLQSALGEGRVCVTSSCDGLEPGPRATYVDKEDVESCPAEGYIGICTNNGVDVYIMDDTDPTLARTGCELAGGTWQEG